MLDDLDEALRQLLIREMPINNNEVDITFEQPKREWSARLSRPTINLFLHDVRENNKLRTQQPYLGTSANGMHASYSPNPVRLDVHYMVSIWANDPSDEHRLLGRLLMVLFQFAEFPQDLMIGELAGHDFPITMKVAQYDQRDVRREVWQMLDNEMRPIVDLTCTLAIEPFAPWEVPLVRETEISFGQLPNVNGSGGTTPTMATMDRFHTVAGMVYGPPEGFDHLSIQLLELAVPVIISPNGRYIIQNLREGVYTLEVWTGEGDPIRHSIVVPSTEQGAYDVHVV